MTPDLYGAWLTAGDRLQPIGAWLAGGGAWLPIFTVAAVIIWRIWRIRPLDQRATAPRQWHVDPPAIDTQPGSDEDDLLTCLQILHATNTTRKEKPQP